MEKAVEHHQPLKIAKEAIAKAQAQKVKTKKQKKNSDPKQIKF